MTRNKANHSTGRDRPAPRPDYEVAYYTKELGRPLQREMLRRKLAEFSDSGMDGAELGHGEPLREAATPRQDRAG